MQLEQDEQWITKDEKEIKQLEWLRG